MFETKLRVGVNLRCLWCLFWHGSESIRTSNGTEVEFYYAKSSKGAVVTGEGCYLEMVERMSR